ncbi:hypothetical protein SDRG_08222 [Saprolegnia diclina VS20]|uniref:Helicase-associated domain-containing protein n=1 Tax=Saprolegnia diclina (strain VS20) TaxID=1156394 RepID=T0Q829_SAPDV|nr:hypothetical protein SDRG_08222 [Saprolegnia diclina VS20]EQC34004.1 hypothetical protein SDRG_08222 [Saprolegnia diclina VS20]|eukprot:XP_008612316.1 hypothetical protein SDRG_08222 [Saprolegnia diclina VS20]
MPDETSHFRVLDLPSAMAPAVQWKTKVEYFAQYRQLMGHCRMTKTFKVPDDDEWPEAMRQYTIGAAAHHFRTLALTHESECFEQLDELGFPWSLDPNHFRMPVFEAATTGVVPRFKKHTTSVLLEWLVQALQTYRIRYGHLDVPATFAVPLEDAWRPELANVALAYAPRVLRSHFYWLASNDAVCLRDLGLCTDRLTWPRALRLLSCFKNNVGGRSVPRDFCVPPDAAWPAEFRGFELGQQVWYLGIKYDVLPEDKRLAIDELQLVFDSPTTWARTVRGLCHHAHVHKATSVPDDFEVPRTSDWPSDLHGLHLGQLYQQLTHAMALRLLPPTTKVDVDAILAAGAVRTDVDLPPRGLLPLASQRHDRAALYAGMPLATRQAWMVVVEALETFLQLFGHIDVPVAFVVPTTASWPWPLASRGLELGAITDSLRTVALDPMQKASLDALGFELVTRHDATSSVTEAAANIESDDKQLYGLAIHRRVKKSAKVIQGYVIAADPQKWPEMLHGFKLGACSHSIRYQDRVLNDAFEAKLKTIGFTWPCNTPSARCVKRTTVMQGLTQRHAFHVHTVELATLVAALETYDSEVGPLGAMEDNFAVPHEDEAWPVGSGGIVLSRVLPALRYHWFELEPNAEKCLRKLGLFADIPPFNDFVKLVARFTRRDETTTIPFDYIVPSEPPRSSSPWRGAPLGELAWTLGLRKECWNKAQTRQLNKIKFEFNTPATWARVVRGLETYCSIVGSIDVPESYIVPHTPEWPDDLHGMRLGHCVKFLMAARYMLMLPGDTDNAVKALAAQVVCAPLQWKELVLKNAQVQCRPYTASAAALPNDGVDVGIHRRSSEPPASQPVSSLVSDPLDRSSVVQCDDDAAAIVNDNERIADGEGENDGVATWQTHDRENTSSGGDILARATRQPPMVGVPSIDDGDDVSLRCAVHASTARQDTSSRDDDADSGSMRALHLEAPQIDDDVDTGYAFDYDQVCDDVGDLPRHQIDVNAIDEARFARSPSICDVDAGRMGDIECPANGNEDNTGGDPGIALDASSNISHDAAQEFQERATATRETTRRPNTRFLRRKQLWDLVGDPALLRNVPRSTPLKRRVFVEPPPWWLTLPIPAVAGPPHALAELDDVDPEMTEAVV